MSAKFVMSENVGKLINDIISKNNLQPISHINHQAGSEAEDGYASKTIAIDIINGKKTVLRLFLKCALNVKSTEEIPIHSLYKYEIYFYEMIYPTYLKFIKERKAADSFRHVPKCYGSSLEDNVLVLENLKGRGFTLFDRRQIMNEKHVVLVLETSAKFHAVSFAFKNQYREKYDALVCDTSDVFGKMTRGAGFAAMYRRQVEEVLTKLDPVEDEHLLKKCGDRTRDFLNCISRVEETVNEYSILTKGDCWCNNVMFLYEGEDRSNPTDIMLIDWQLIRLASPVFDLSYFFYTTALEETLNKLDYYLRIYHEELSKQIRELGSDPDVLYPFHVFNEEWKRHAKYGFAMAFLLVKIMLSSKDEVLNMEDLDFEDTEQLKNLYPPIKRQDEYIRRMKLLGNHMVENDFL